MFVSEDGGSHLLLTEAMQIHRRNALWRNQCLYWMYWQLPLKQEFIVSFLRCKIYCVLYR